MTKCFVCNNYCSHRPNYFICENNHITTKHKHCKIKYSNCSFCNSKLVGFSVFPINNKFMADYKYNYYRKYKDLKYKKFQITVDVIKDKILLHYPDHYNKLKAILERISYDNLKFDNEIDFDNYLFFIINKPN